jgi:hypothetical protein
LHLLGDAAATPILSSVTLVITVKQENFQMKAVENILLCNSSGALYMELDAQ